MAQNAASISLSMDSGLPEMQFKFQLLQVIAGYWEKGEFCPKNIDKL
jgi:hypothetical protein